LIELIIVFHVLLLRVAAFLRSLDLFVVAHSSTPECKSSRAKEKKTRSEAQKPNRKEKENEETKETEFKTSKHSYEAN
jgi:hypothetical protein